MEKQLNLIPRNHTPEFDPAHKRGRNIEQKDIFNDGKQGANEIVAKILFAFP